MGRAGFEPATHGFSAESACVVNPCLLNTYKHKSFVPNDLHVTISHIIEQQIHSVKGKSYRDGYKNLILCLRLRLSVFRETPVIFPCFGPPKPVCNSVCQVFEQGAGSRLRWDSVRIIPLFPVHLRRFRFRVAFRP